MPSTPHTAAFAGSHAGVSIGEDGPSQMALEDLAMMRGVPNCTVFYPSDAVSAYRLVAAAASTPRPVYLRLSRPKTPVIYAATEPFPVGGSKTLRASDRDAVTVVAAGVTVFEALGAHDALAKDNIAIRIIDAYSVQPIDGAALVAAGRATGGRVITVEDHYANGGLGDAVSSAVWDQGFRIKRLAVREIPRSGQPEELLDRYGISSRSIVAAVRRVPHLSEMSHNSLAWTKHLPALKKPPSSRPAAQASSPPGAISSFNSSSSPWAF